MLKQNSIKTGDNFSWREGIPDGHMPIWEFVERWLQIQSGISQDAHDILENIEPQEAIEEQRQEFSVFRWGYGIRCTISGDTLHYVPLPFYYFWYPWICFLKDFTPSWEIEFCRSFS